MATNEEDTPLPSAEEAFGFTTTQDEGEDEGRDVPRPSLEQESSEDFFGFEPVEVPERYQRQEPSVRDVAEPRTEREAEEAGVLDQLFDEAQAEGKRLQEKQREFQENLPEYAEDVRENVPKVMEDIKRGVTTGDALKGFARGGIGFATSIGSGLLRAPGVVEVAGMGIEQIPGLEDVGRNVREFGDIDALEDAADWLNRRSRQSQAIIGQPETITGTATEVVTRLGLELAGFAAAGQALRSAAGAAEASNIGRLADAASKLSNPQTALARFSQDMLSGNVLDYLIGASGKENASIPFLHRISKKKEVREGLEERGIDPEDVTETLAWFNQSDQRRGLGEAIIGTALESVFEVTRGVLGGGRSLLGRAADEGTIEPEVLGRDEPIGGEPRPGMEVEVEGREVGEPTRARGRQIGETRPPRAALPADVEEAPARFQVEETERGARVVDTETQEPVTESRTDVETIDAVAERLNVEAQGREPPTEGLDENQESLFQRARRKVAETIDPTLRQEAETDDLTGLLNRRGERRALRQEASPDAKRVTVEGDLDNFKAVNDNLGYEAGNRTIELVAAALRNATRDADAVLARQGGDEFRVTLELPQDADPTAAVRRIEQEVNDALAEAGVDEVNGTPVGFSLGRDVKARKAERGVSMDREAREARESARAAGEGPEDVTRATEQEGPDVSAAQEANERATTQLEELPEQTQAETPSTLREMGYEQAARQKEESLEEDLENFFRGGETADDVEESVATGRTGSEAAEDARTSSEGETPEAADTRPEEPGEASESSVRRRAEELGDRDVGEVREPIATGAVRTVQNADGTEVTTQYKVYEAGELIPSHNPTTGFSPRQDYPEIVQERRYHADDDAQSFVFTGAREHDPSITLSPTQRPTDGPPITLPDRIVLGGNARSQMLQLMYDQFPDRARVYREELLENADRIGAGGQRQAIESADEPVLVREVVDREVDPSDRGQLAELASKFNDVPTRSRDPLGEAQTRARRLLDNGGALEFYGNNIAPDQTLRAFLRTNDGRRWLQRLVDEGTIKPEAATTFRLDDGTISDEGKVALERMMFAATVDDPEVLSRAPKSVLRDLTHAVPPLVKAQSVEGFDLGPVIRNTLDYLHRFRNSEFDTLDEYASQTGMFEEANERTKAMARFLDEENRATIKAGFRKYAEDAQEAAGQREANDLFGREPISDDEAFEKRFVDRVHEPEIPGLRGGSRTEQGFINPDVQSAIARTGTGFVFGSMAGGQFGNTPEQKWRNAMVVGIAGAAAPNVAKFAMRRLGPDEWDLGGRLSDFASRVVKKGGRTDPDDPMNLREMLRQGYRQIWRSRKTIEDASNDMHKMIRGNLSEERDPAVWAQLTSSAGEHADQSLRYGPHRPGTTNYRTRRGLMQVLEEVGRRQDELRIYGVLRRTLEDLEPRGFFDEEAEELIDEEGMAGGLPVPFELEEARRVMEEEFGRVVEPGGNVVEKGDPRLDAWFREIQEIDDAQYEIMEEMGVLRSGAAERIRGQNPNYWPFERDIPPELTRKYSGEGGWGEPGPPSQYFEGSEARILDPIETLVVQHYRYSDLLFKQQVYNGLAENAELLRAARDEGTELDIRPIDPPQRRVNLSGKRLESELPDHVTGEVEDDIYEMWIPREVRADDPVFRHEMPDGKIQYFEVSQEMVEALQGMNAPRIRAWARIMAPAARWLRTGVTVMPDFMLANMSRDVKLRAATDPLLGAGPGASFSENLVRAPQAYAQSLSATVRALGELLSTEIGLSEASEMERLWRSTGGPFGFQDIDRDQLAAQLRKQRIAGEGPKAVVEHPIDALRAIGDRIRGLGIAVENATRFGAFRDVVEQAGGPDARTALRGAMAGKDVTVDFSLRGSSQVINELRQISSFWGARMQGEDKLRRALHPRPEDLPERLREQGMGREPDAFRGETQASPKKAFATAIALSTIPSIGLYMVNRENPDYWQLPTWEKNFVRFIPLPGLENIDLPDELVEEAGGSAAEAEKYLSPFARRGSTTWLRLPKAHTLDWLFSSVPMRFIEAFDPANPYMDESIGDAVVSNAREFGSILQSYLPLPTAATPFIENFFNYDFFTNRGVLTDFEEASPEPERLKGRSRSTRVARNIADVLDAAPGEWNNVAPPEVDNLFSDWFGGSGRLLLQGVDVVGRPDHVGPRPETELSEQPLLRETLGRFIREGDRYSPRSITEFYDRYERANNAYRDYRSRFENASNRLRSLRQLGRDVRLNEMPEIGEAQEVVRANLEQLLKRDIYSNIQQELSLIEDARERIQGAPNLSSSQKDAYLSNLRNLAGFITSMASFKPDEREKLLERQTFERTGDEELPIQGNALPQRYRKWARELEKAEQAVRRVKEGGQSGAP